MTIPIEPALDHEDLALGHRIGIFTAWPEIDQRATAAVVDDELVAEDLGDAAMHGRRRAGLQRVDGRRLQQHDATRLPLLGEPHAAGSGSSADREHGKRYACEQTAMPGLRARGGRRAHIRR